MFIILSLSGAILKSNDIKAISPFFTLFFGDKCLLCYLVVILIEIRTEGFIFFRELSETGFELYL